MHDRMDRAREEGRRGNDQEHRHTARLLVPNQLLFLSNQFVPRPGQLFECDQTALLYTQWQWTRLERKRINDRGSRCWCSQAKFRLRMILALPLGKSMRDAWHDVRGSLAIFVCWQGSQPAAFLPRQTSWLFFAQNRGWWSNAVAGR